MTYKARISDATQEMVYELLKDEADLDGLVIVEQSYIADKIGIARTTVSGAIQNLTARGFVTFVSHDERTGINSLQLIDF